MFNAVMGMLCPKSSQQMLDEAEALIKRATELIDQAVDQNQRELSAMHEAIEDCESNIVLLNAHTNKALKLKDRAKAVLA